MAGAMIDRRKTLRPDRRVLLVVAALLVVSLAWVLPQALRSSSAPDAATPATSVPAATPTLPPPLGHASAPARLSPPLAPGTVALAVGTFAGRARFEQLAVRAGPVPAVTGVARYLAASVGDGSGDVVIGLQADFYDAAGNRVGAGAATVRQPTEVALAEEGGRRRALPFQVAANGPAPGAVAARLAVTTVLVDQD
jgi:hypothetical protein